MKKFILKYEYGDGCTFSCSTVIPFEYSCKEDFQFMVLEEIDKHKKECIKQYGHAGGQEYYRNGYIKILNGEYNVGSLEDWIDHIYELDEWFELEKLKNK